MARRKMASLRLELPDELQPKKLPKNLTSDHCEQLHCKYWAPASGARSASDGRLSGAW
jgi:hypothetical protein